MIFLISSFLIIFSFLFLPKFSKKLKIKIKIFKLYKSLNNLINNNLTNTNALDKVSLDGVIILIVLAFLFLPWLIILILFKFQNYSNNYSFLLASLPYTSLIIKELK